MNRLTLFLGLLILLCLFIFNIRVVTDLGRPSYIISCRTQWSLHWWGSITDKGLLGLYSLDQATNNILKQTSSLEYIPEKDQKEMAVNILLRPCA